MTMKRSLILTATLLAVTHSARAVPVPTQHVPATARWLICVDVDQLRHNPVAVALRDRGLIDDRASTKLAKMKKDLGLRSWDDLKSILVYGTDFEGHDAVLIIHAKIDQAAVVDRIKSKHGYTVSTSDKRTVHSWTYKKSRGKDDDSPYKILLHFYSDDRAVLCRDPKALKAAITVLNGQAANLTSGKAVLRARVPATASLYLEAAGPVVKSQRVGRHAQLLRQAKHLSFSVAHGADDLQLTMHVTTEDADVAMSIVQVIEGFRAMMLLRHPRDEAPQVHDAIRTLRVETKAGRISVTWPISNGRMIQVIEHRRRNAPHGRKPAHSHDAE